MKKDYHFRIITTMFKMSIVSFILCGIIGITACSDNDKTEDTDEPVKPVEPASSGDKQNVPVSGGTITKGDIAITFPSGTFSKDTKVSVKEVTKGSVLGEDEASTFYQVQLPVSASKPMTISIKCNEKSDDICFVTYVPSRSLHNPDSVTYAPISYEATYSNGQYTATLPAFDNGKEDGEIEIAMGLGKIVQFSSANDIDQTATTRVVINGETEGDISWHYEVGAIYYLARSKRLATVVPKINEYMHEAVKQITTLKFTVRSKRNIPILFKTLDEDEWGLFKQHATNDEKSWIELTTKIVNTTMDEDEVKQTIIHELFHYFQSDYDTRLPINKYRQCGGDELMIYECGGRWVEKFMNNGIPPIKDYKHRLPYFVRGMFNLEEIYAKDNDCYDELSLEWLRKFFGFETKSFSFAKARQSHGYAMGSLLVYLSKEYGDDKIVDFYEDWTRNSLSTMQTTFKTFQNFAASKGSTLFMGGYYNYLLDLATGKVIPEIRAKDLNSSPKHQLDPDHTSHNISSKCYPYGGDLQYIELNFEQNYSLKNKELVIKNVNPKSSYLTTYIVACKKYMDHAYDDYIMAGDSLVIPGDSLESFRKDNGNNRIKMVGFMLISTTHESSKTVEYKLTLELRDAVSVSPNSLAYSADGGTQSTFIKYGSYSYYGASVRKEGHGWCGVSTPGGPGGEIRVTVQPNTTGKKRECIVDCYVCESGNTPENERLKMPVKITQEAGGNDTPDTPTEAQSLEVLEMELTSELKAEYWRDGEQRHYEPYETRKPSFKFDSFDSKEKKTATGTLSKNTLHFECTSPENSSGLPSLTFDVQNFTDDYYQSVAANIEFKSGINYYMTIGRIPVVTYVQNTGQLRHIYFEATEAQGMTVTQYKEHIENSSGVTDFVYQPNSSNKAFLRVMFRVPKSSSASSRSIVAPWNITPSVHNLISHVEASVKE